MPSYCERKKDRKLKKYSNILLRDWDISSSEEPTNYVMICNAGLLSGLSEIDVVTYFSKFGQIDRVCMVPHKSYSFISFCELSSAIKCVSKVTEDSEINNKFGNLHLLYVRELPAVKRLYEDYDFIPPGLIVVEDFLTETEEKALFDLMQVSDECSDKVMRHRSVKHFGYAFNYDNNNVDKSKPLEDKIPQDFDFLENRFREKGLSNVINWTPDQLTTNFYLPGQGIPPHVDTHSAFEDPILSISLLSDIVMEFEKCDKSKKTSVLIPRRSLLVMSKEARYYWTHGITPRKSDVFKTSSGLMVRHRESRMSLTFRRIRQGNCECAYPSVCDSFIKNNLKIPSDENADKIERDYVHKVYESISDHFSLTRHSPWPNVLDFVMSLPTGSVLLDIGCGNGKYFNLNKNIFHFGGDTCSKLMAICKEKGEALMFNCLSLPFLDNIADAVICIAVLHHLSTPARRKHAVQEIYRVLRPNGRALIYVWAIEQNDTNYIKDESAGNESDTVGNSTIAAFINDTDVLPVHSNRKQFQHNDILVPWNLRLKDKEESCHLRYYHVFREGELEEICSEIGAIVEKSYYDDGNWCLEMSKICNS